MDKIKYVVINPMFMKDVMHSYVEKWPLQLSENKIKDTTNIKSYGMQNIFKPHYLKNIKYAKV
jgi:hypothetical protein